MSSWLQITSTCDFLRHAAGSSPERAFTLLGCPKAVMQLRLDGAASLQHGGPSLSVLRNFAVVTRSAHDEGSEVNCTLWIPLLWMASPHILSFRSFSNQTMLVELTVSVTF